MAFEGMTVFRPTATGPATASIAPILQAAQIGQQFNLSNQFAEERAGMAALNQEQQQIKTDALNEAAAVKERVDSIGKVLFQGKAINDPNKMRAWINNIILESSENEDSPIKVADAVELRQMLDDPSQGIDAVKAEIDSDLEQLVPVQDKLNQMFGIGKGQAGFSAKTVAYNNGVSVQFDNRGNRVVTDQTGATVTGQDAADVIQSGVDSGVAEQAARAGARTEATETSQRNSALVARGVAAAESTANIRRALTLLDKVKTGGIAAISLAAQSRLGIEGADAGELSNSLGKSVLSQLRETFGAAFTESEGLRLERIEAGFGKSLATNRRLLAKALRIAENTAKRAAKVASEGEAADIEELLAFSLDIEEPGAEAEASGMIDNGDGTFTLPDGRIVRRKGG